WSRRVVSVAPIIAKTKPEEMPRNSAAMGAGSQYGRRPSGSLLTQRVVIVDRQRRVVGEAARLVDRFLDRRPGHAGRGDLVVDAPADVLLPCLVAVGPPGVRVGLQIQLAVEVHLADVVERT